MVEFINKLTGTKMLVPDERAAKYEAAGHKPVAAPKKPAKAEPKAEEPKPEEPAKKPAAKRKKKAK